MNDIPRLHRAWIGFVGLNAAFVAAFGLSSPRSLDEKFTWAELPPLHARFVGGLYLFGAVLLLGSLLCRKWAQVAPIAMGAAIFTTSMLVLTLLNWDAFDLDLFGPKVWVAAYVIFPPTTLAIALMYRRRPIVEGDGRTVPVWLKVALQIGAAIFGLLGLALLLARDPLADAWPWPVADGVAQFYGGPFLTLAWCAWWYSNRRLLGSLQLYLAAMTALGVSVMIVSLKHRSLFDAGDPATWLWFATFVAISVGAAAALVLAIARRRSGASATARSAV